jgi:pre-mRNA-processing factor SLU7
MSQQHFSEPPSILARKRDGDGPKKQSREEYKKQKELEELRKAGNAPAEVDESGKDINPHIPKYMVDLPWYVTYDRSQPTLKHQRVQDEKKVVVDGMEKWYARGSTVETKISTKYRQGACENCGALGHSRKDCLEKPRKRLAKYGAGIIAPDDFKQPELNLSFDGKRDRWNGVDVDYHQQKIRADFEKLEEARRMMKAKKLEEQDAEKDEANNPTTQPKAKHDSDDEEEDEYKYADEMEVPGQKLHLESKQRISVRNLRMREDTAKYLLNLDPNSAYYDPKSRSMRGNPLADKGESSNIPYVGDNYVRYSGEADKFNRTQIFAWEAYEKGVDVHVQAEPTKLELLHKEFKQRYEETAKNIKSNVLEKYGGAEHLEAMPKELIFAQTENYSEYSRYGNVVKTQEKASTKSKYVEDEHVNGHTAVWGSYFKDGKWGYTCCKSSDRNSYCTGGVPGTSSKLNLSNDDAKE